MASHAPALLLYAALTVGVTWPLVLRLGDGVPHDLGDPLLSTWVLWWNAHVVPFSDRWWDGLGFFPSRGMLALSDHRVGIGLITTPLILAGASPLAAHNLAFLLTFFLCASAAYALSFVLTSSRAAALIGGLVFGFNPYRADHLPHLELLASWWLPVILLALHRWAATQAVCWLVALGIALLMQALTSGYYFFFAGVLLALWLIWFAPRALPRRQYLGLGAALLGPLLTLAPILLEYRRAHESMGLARAITDIEMFSADLMALVTAPNLLAFWNTPADWYRPEGALLPGVTAVLLVAAALARRGRTLAPASAWLQRLRPILLFVGGAFVAIALVPALHGPVAFEAGGVRISTSDAYKPLSIAALALGAWALTSGPVRTAWAHQSLLVFYALATAAMWIFALGPTARVLGHRFLYKAPYAWLMLLPGFRDSFRVPARFGMLAALTLSVGAAVALWKLLEGRGFRARVTAASLVGAAVVVESWIAPFPVIDAPAPLEVPAAVPAAAAIAELPFGVFEDGVALFHSISHRRPTVNGLSGYDPPHQAALRIALREQRVEALSAVAAAAPIAIFVGRDAQGAGLAARLIARTQARPIGQTNTHEVLLLPRSPALPDSPPAGDPIAVRDLTSTIDQPGLARMLDGDRHTAWRTQHQSGDEAFTADLGRSMQVSGLVLASGGYTWWFARAVAIELSTNGESWTEAWRGENVTRTVSAALADPRLVRVPFSFTPAAARYVRVRQIGVSREPWAVAELTVFGDGH